MKPPSLKPPARPWWKPWPCVRQLDDTDCGIACLATVIAVWGGSANLHTLREEAGVGLDGTSLLALRDVAAQQGLIAEGLQIPFGGSAGWEGLTALPLPLIAHRFDNHYVVLLEQGRQHVRVADPGLGVHWLPREELERTWSGYVLVLRPQGPLPQRACPSPAQRLGPLVRDHAGPLAQLVGLALVYDLLGLAAPWLTQGVVDRALPQQNLSLLHLLVAALAAFGLGQVATEAVRAWQVLHLANHLEASLAARLYRHVLRLPLHVLERRSVGDLLGRFGEVGHLASMVTSVVTGALLDTFLAVIYLACMGYYSPRLTLVVVTTLPLLVACSVALAPRLRDQHRTWAEQAAHAGACLTETLSGLRTLRSLGLEAPGAARWEELYRAGLAASARASTTQTAVDSLTNLGSRGISLLLLLVGVGACIRGELTLGTLMAFNVLLGAVMLPLSRLLGLWDGLQQGVVALERYAEILDLPPEPPGVHEVPRDALPRLVGVTVHLGAPSQPPVLEAIELELGKGECVALVGSSGAGKSTLLRVLLGLVLPTSGEVVIGSHSLHEYHLPPWRAGLGVVMQDALVFSGTLRANVCGYPGSQQGTPPGGKEASMPSSTSYPRPLKTNSQVAPHGESWMGVRSFSVAEPAPIHEANEDRVWEALRRAGLEGFVQSLPHGLETRVGERGTRLSGGQAQRLALARALYRRASLLILDEPTSQLDETTEHEVLQAVLAYARSSETTLVMVTHRSAALKGFDRVLEVRDRTLHPVDLGHPAGKPTPQGTEPFAGTHLPP